MTWNYRILAPLDDNDVFSLIEVYYDDHGQIEGWSDAHMGQADTLDEMIDTLKLMAAAAEQSKLSQDRCRLLTRDDLPDDREDTE